MASDFDANHFAHMQRFWKESFCTEWALAAPYWQFIAIRDSRSEDGHRCPGRACLALDGVVFRKDDASAMRFWPQLHTGCRCDVMEVGSSRLARLGLRVSAGTDFDALALPKRPRAAPTAAKVRFPLVPGVE